MDLDGDGRPDILSGSWPGQLYFFKGLGQGKFAARQTLADKAGKPIKLGSASTVFAVDWNADGKLDLLIGDVQGRVHLMDNEGTTDRYAFAKSQELSAGGSPIRVNHGDSHPIAIDWDGDGLLDLLVGCGDGSVLFHKNIGSAAAPRLAKAQTLVPAAHADDSTSDQIRPGTRAKICAVDWNGDGRIDLLVGDFCGYKAKIEVPDKDRQAVEEARRKEQELSQEIHALGKEMSEITGGPRKKETPAETEQRERKVTEISDRYQGIAEAFQQDVSALAKLNSLAQPTTEQRKEMAALRGKLAALTKTYARIMEEIVPLQHGPFDEPPEKTRLRAEKAGALFARQFPLHIESALLQEIIRPYAAHQLAGSVWLYLREPAERPSGK